MKILSKDTFVTLFLALFAASVASSIFINVRFFFREKDYQNKLIVKQRKIETLNWNLYQNDLTIEDMEFEIESLKEQLDECYVKKQKN